MGKTYVIQGKGKATFNSSDNKFLNSIWEKLNSMFSGNYNSWLSGSYERNLTPISGNSNPTRFEIRNSAFPIIYEIELLQLDNENKVLEFSLAHKEFSRKMNSTEQRQYSAYDMAPLKKEVIKVNFDFMRDESYLNINYRAYYSGTNILSGIFVGRSIVRDPKEWVRFYFRLIIDDYKMGNVNSIEGESKIIWHNFL